MIRFALSCAVIALVAACGGDSGPQNDGPPPPAYPLIEEQNAAYTVNITIGGGQSFDVTVDTGSTTLAIAASTCANCTGVTPLWTPDATAVDNGGSASSSYGDGTSWDGEVYTDSMAVTGDPNVVPKMKFAAITSQNGFFRPDEPAEGILGFGSTPLAVPNTDSYVSERIDNQFPGVFAFQLCPENGTLWFGGADKTHEVSDEQYTALQPINDNQPFYLLDVTSASLDGHDLSLSGGALADTGTTMMLLPTATYDAMTSAIVNSDGWKSIFGAEPFPTLQCSATTAHSKNDIDAALPQMQVTMNDLDGKPFTVSLPATSSYLLQMGPSYCSDIADAGPAGSIGGGINAILGDAFLRAFITVFDTQNLKIGFAPQQNCTFPTARQAPPTELVPFLHGHPDPAHAVQLP
jgi:cathepsin D